MFLLLLVIAFSLFLKPGFLLISDFILKGIAPTLPLQQDLQLTDWLLNPITGWTHNLN